MKMLRLPGIAVLFASLLVVVGPAASQEKADYKVVLYDHKDFKGKSHVIRKGTPNLTADKFNDITSSLKWNIAPGKAAVLCDEKDYKRPVLILVGTGELADVKKDHPNAHGVISSITFVACPKGGHPKGVSKDVAKLGDE
jgi:hypothetical protein